MDSELVTIVDEKLHLSDLFHGAVFSIAEVGNTAKPSPDIFLYAAKKLNSLPVNCVVIEDSLYGIEAAKRAGMRCVALTTTYSCLQLIHADVVVDSYA